MSDDAAPTTTIPTLAAIASKLDAVLASNNAVLTEVHRMQRVMRQFVIPIEILSTAQAAKRLGAASVRTVERYIARGIFTDARESGKQGTKSPRRLYADEVEALRVDGERGVERLREQLGRD